MSSGIALIAGDCDRGEARDLVVELESEKRLGSAMVDGSVILWFGVGDFGSGD